jgi:hypothetical protein
MKATEIWFGDMTHGQFSVADDDLERMVVIHSIEEKAIMNPDDADEYMLAQGHDSYLIPDEFDGAVVFSTRFIKGLAP